jgi:hypothetical protein
VRKIVIWLTILFSQVTKYRTLRRIGTNYCSSCCDVIWLDYYKYRTLRENLSPNVSANLFVETSMLQNKYRTLRRI